MGISHLRELIDAYRSGDAELNDWEENFIVDLSTRLEKYGESLQLSAKQEGKLEEMHERYCT